MTAKTLTRHRGRPKSLKAKFKPLLQFLNTPAAWMRTCGSQFDSAGKREVDQKRRAYLAALRSPLPTGSMRDLDASLRWVRKQNFVRFQNEEKQFDRGESRRGGWTARDLLDAVRGKAIPPRVWRSGKKEFPREIAQKHINAIRANPRWAWRRFDDTERQVKALVKLSRDPSLFEPPPLTDGERSVLQAGGPPAVRLLLGRIEWLFQAACQNGLLVLCDICQRQGFEPPRVFLRGPYQGHRKDCDRCRRIPEATRWRIRQRTRLRKRALR